MHVHCQYHKLCLSFNIAKNQGKLSYVNLPSTFTKLRAVIILVMFFSAMQLFCYSKANLITRPRSSGAFGHLLKCTELTINWIDPKDAWKSLCRLPAIGDQQRLWWIHSNRLFHWLFSLRHSFRCLSKAE